jgi:hypothetical protein
MAELNEEERNNKEIDCDYVCGLQIFDNSKRIYILES